MTETGFDPSESLVAIESSFTDVGVQEESHLPGNKTPEENIGQKKAVGKKWLVLPIIPLTLILA